MKPIEEVYPEHKDCEYFYGPCDYKPLLESIGTIALQVDDSDYQGDSRVLYRDDARVGYLQFGWGSCSGCDALQACNTMKDISDLRDGLVKEVRWFGDAAAALAFFDTHDWEGDYAFDQSFVDQCKAYLKGAMS